MKLKKLFIGLAAVVIMIGTLYLLAPITNSLAKLPKASPKTTGGVGYTAAGLQRYAQFEAIATSDKCANADVNGKYIINVTYLGINYPEDLTLSQTGTGITGTSLELVGGGSSWTIDSGFVIGNSISFDGFFDSNPVMRVHFSGTIAADGSMSGYWNDVAPGSRAGTWESTSGNAVTIIGCSGKGSFHYSDVNGGWYNANVYYVNVDETDAYFAGHVISASNPSWVGNWVQVADHDGGEPAYLMDYIWGIFTDSNTAKSNVANKVHPNGDFVITSGNLQVH